MMGNLSQIKFSRTINTHKREKKNLKSKRKNVYQNMFQQQQEKKTVKKQLKGSEYSL